MRPLIAAAAVLILGFAPAPFLREKPRPAEGRGGLEGLWIVESCRYGGVIQGGPGHTWLTVRIKDGTWTQSCKVDGRELWTTPYLITLNAKDRTLIDIAYPGMKTALIYGVYRLEGRRLHITHATSGPTPTGQTGELRNGQTRWVLRRAE